MRKIIVQKVIGRCQREISSDRGDSVRDGERREMEQANGRERKRQGERERDRQTETETDR